MEILVDENSALSFYKNEDHIVIYLLCQGYH